MSTSYRRQKATVERRGGNASMIDKRSTVRDLLVAIDGSGAACAVVEVAAALTRARGTRSEVLSVVTPYTAGMLPLGDEGAMAQAPKLLAERRACRRAVGHHLAEHIPDLMPWPVRIAFGTPADVIVGEARKRDANLIVMGLRSHGTLDRIFRDETTLRVIRLSPVPVLAVTPCLRAMARRVIVAIDFSRASAAAARVAFALFRGHAKFVLAYVESGLDVATAALDEGWNLIQTEGVIGAFRRLREELALPDDESVETIVLRGDPVTELSAFAGHCGADVLALGSQRHGLADRLLVGSVTTALVREAPCSLLITPPPPAARDGADTSLGDSLGGDGLGAR